MGFIIICIIIYVLYKFFTSGSTNSAPATSSDSKIIYADGQFEDGNYIEELNVFLKGPVYTYDLGSSRIFFGFNEGQLKIKNSSGELLIDLMKSRDGRMLPVTFFINNKVYKVIDKHGNLIDGVVNLSNVSLARTTNYILNEQEDSNMDFNSQKATYEVLLGLLTFNLLTKRRIILTYAREYIEIANNYTYNLLQEISNYENIATDTINKYEQNYLKDQMNNIINDLLTILNLPLETRDLEKIKKQYKLLAKKHHPDMHGGSDEKFKEINHAYEQLCNYLKAS